MSQIPEGYSPTMFHLPVVLKRSLKRHAEQRGTTMTAIVRELLADYLHEQYQKK